PPTRGKGSSRAGFVLSLSWFDGRRLRESAGPPVAPACLVLSFFDFASRLRASLTAGRAHRAGRKPPTRAYRASPGARSAGVTAAGAGATGRGLLRRTTSTETFDNCREDQLTPPAGRTYDLAATKLPSPERKSAMAVDEKTLEMLHTEPDITEGVDLSWMDQTGERGMTAKPGRRDLMLEEINKGSYGSAPQMSMEATGAPRGAARRPGVPRLGYRLPNKSDTWSDNAAMLYEEAVQRQWSSATDIPWEELKPLPDDVERAYSQFCTFLTEVEFIAGDTPSQWLPQISNDHYEVKMFLASQIMDEARHLDVFRKRALANGGGLMRSSGNAGLRVIIEAKDFTEMSAIMHVQGEGL